RRTARPPETIRMATRKSRTSAAAGAPTPEGAGLPVEDKPKKKKPAARPKAKPAAKTAPAAGAPAPDGAGQPAPKRRGRFASAAPKAPEPEVDEAEIEASMGDKANG